MDITLAYRLLAFVVALGCAWEVFSSRDRGEQVTAAVVLIPLLLRAFLIK